MAERICLGLATAVAIQHRRGELIEKKLCERNSQQDYILLTNEINKTWASEHSNAFDDTTFIMRSNSQTKSYSNMKNIQKFVHWEKQWFCEGLYEESFIFRAPAPYKVAFLYQYLN